MSHHKAFTLAEVLITLGIIGIVAAMTIPALQQRIFERQTMAKVKTTYSILTQALKLSAELDDNGYPEGWGLSGRTASDAVIVAEKLKPHLKILNDCGTATDNKCRASKFSYLNGSTYTPGSSRYWVTLLNGATVSFSSGETNNNLFLYFFIDTNGPAQPNTWGRDLFEFTYSEEYGLVPSGYPQIPSNDYRVHCANLLSTGYGCAYYILTFGNMNYLH